MQAVSAWEFAMDLLQNRLASAPQAAFCAAVNCAAADLGDSEAIRTRPKSEAKIIFERVLRFAISSILPTASQAGASEFAPIGCPRPEGLPSSPGSRSVVPPCGVCRLA
jgi:hypothetical protein